MHESSKMKFLLAVCVLMAFLPLSTVAGPLVYGICQTGCNAGAVACYAAAGFTFGAVTAGASTPLVIMGCNGALGVCMAGCVAAGFTPTL